MPLARAVVLVCTLTFSAKALAQCAETPACGCREATQSSLVLKDRAHDEWDVLWFKWIKGAETTTAEFGDPALDTDYALCLYDADGLIASLEIAGGDAAWSPLSRERGFRYRDTTGSQDGVTKILLRSGTEGKTKFVMKGRGLNLPDVALELGAPVTVQLVNQASRLCWTATYGGPGMRRNDAERFQAIALAPTPAPECTPTETPTITPTPTADVSYPLVDTNQSTCYSDLREASCPASGAAFHGQDAQYDGKIPAYTSNGDGTVTDNVSGLMWQQDPGGKMTYAAAVAGAATFNLAGHTDWRLPTVKELYSLILFSGEDPSGEAANDTSRLTPFIDAETFAFTYGDPGAGERIIDSQWATSSVYGSTVMGGHRCFFGVNFADGRIKCYPTTNKTYFTIYVRGNARYGNNSLTDNGNYTVSDAATGLMWMQDDNGAGVPWADALAYCEGLTLAGHDDWRLPNAKELESIVDYSRSPDTTGSAAIDPVFNCTSITNEAGQADYPFYWSSTTHVKSNGMGDAAAYVSFGRAMGYWLGRWQDVHGAGAQRSDPKTGDPSDFPYGHGPQGDAIRIYNYVRCVRDGG